MHKIKWAIILNNYNQLLSFPIKISSECTQRGRRRNTIHRNKKSGENKPLHINRAAMTEAKHRIKKNSELEKNK
jgi:hypothetical protein